MIGSAPSDLPFRDRLRAVHDLSIRHSEASSFDELCRLDVKEGGVALGVDRMGLWFRIGETMEAEGSFGVDEAGQIRDERGARVTCAPGSQMWRVLSYASPAVLAKDAALLDHHADPVGKGDTALGALWDGSRVIGCLCVDNLLSQVVPGVAQPLSVCSARSRRLSGRMLPLHEHPEGRHRRARHRVAGGW